MNILIKTISIINFKGVKNFKIDFSEVTNIFGANATGKTTIFDAFLWLLFGKDSNDRKDFNIKPLDLEGQKTDKLENEVSAIIVVDGEEISIRHIHREKWTKKRGEAIAEFTGNEHLYYWNEVPLQAGEFQAKVNGLLDEKVFKLITNPLYFNSMPWQDQRTALSSIVGEITDDFLSSKYPELKVLLENLAGKSLKEFKAKVASDKRLLKDNIEQIPGRIDELERSKPELVSEEGLNERIAELQSKYDLLDKQITDRNEAYNAANAQINKAILDNQNAIHQAKIEKQNIEANHKAAYNSELNNSQSGINEAKSRVTTLESQLSVQTQQLDSLVKTHFDHLKRLEKDKEDIGSRMDSLRELFKSVNGRELNENDTCCSGCGREFDPTKLEEVKAAFVLRKKNELDGINIQGQGLKKDLERRNEEGRAAIEQFETTKNALDASIINIQNSLAEAKTKLEAFAGITSTNIESVESRLSKDQLFQVVCERISLLENEVFDKPEIDLGDLRVQKATVNADIDALKRQLTVGDQIDRANARIKELMEQERGWSQQLADLEKLEFSAEKYEKAKAEELESRVNGLFKYAKFTLFSKLNNGGEEPTCKATFNGVPFSDLNTAGKILVGIDIINTLSAHYKVTAPVFLDNRESISVIPETAAQVVNLIVSPFSKLNVGLPLYSPEFLAEFEKYKEETGNSFDAFIDRKLSERAA
ncbi:AAA family ATPase [Sphingobacterium sp.]|uniref:AAA family ATPase n=1 Tax=Sphingobacterium sp. TaxID=341027 RepID=UPI0028A22982|nr:AAA family ATPase [Sphingobacterium sp.]